MRPLTKQRNLRRQGGEQMSMGVLRLVIALLVPLFGCPADVVGYQSDWLSAYDQIGYTHRSACQYRRETGRYPSASELWNYIGSVNEWSDVVFKYGYTDGAGLDAWGTVYRYEPPVDPMADPADRSITPRIWSCGADGIDSAGLVDDISNFRGVNAGYYWKSGWPLARILCAGGAIAVVLVLSRAPRRVSWRGAIVFSCLIASGTALVASPLAVTPWMVGGLQDYVPWSRWTWLFGILCTPVFALMCVLHWRASRCASMSSE